jgi:hypothetical protein
MKATATATLPLISGGGSLFRRLDVKRLCGRPRLSSAIVHYARRVDWREENTNRANFRGHC